MSQIWDRSVLTLFIGRNDVFYPDVWYIHQSLSFISILSNYNIYHTNLILLYHFDALSIDLKSTIPRSTLSNWKRKDISRIIGCDSLSGNDVSVLKEIAKSKKLLRAAKALYYLFNTISSLFKYADNKDELLRLNKTVILNTIEKVQPILGTKRILKSLRIICLM